jgi:uncharacterized protein with PIN domain
MKFICDDMVGRLCKWLRILGYDALYFRGSDSELAAISRSQERVVLTRDRELPKRKILNQSLILKSDETFNQLQEVLLAFKLLPIQRESFFSRCLECNRILSQIEKEKVKDQAPEYVYNTHHLFYQCPQCKKIFWSGTHVENTRLRLEKLLNLIS